MIHKNMTSEEAKKYYGKEIWDKMCKTELLTGITGKIVNGKFVIYASDLENAYNKVKTGKTGFID